MIDLIEVMSWTVPVIIVIVILGSWIQFFRGKI
jgi:hypothetical protein